MARCWNAAMVGVLMQTHLSLVLSSGMDIKSPCMTAGTSGTTADCIVDELGLYQSLIHVNARNVAVPSPDVHTVAGKKTRPADWPGRQVALQELDEATAIQTTGEQALQHRLDEPISILTIVGFVVTTISFVSSIQASKKAEKVDRAMREASKQLAATYQEQALSGCQSMNQLADLLDKKQKGFFQLHSSAEQMQEVCKNGARITQTVGLMDKYLRATCASLAEPVGLADAKTRCDEAVQVIAQASQKICTMNGKDLNEQAWTLNTKRAQLDGLIDGLCFGVSEFTKTAQTFGQKQISLLERQSTENVDVHLNSVGLIDIMGWLGLAMSLYGIGDAALSVYSSAVNHDNAYTTLLNLADRQQAFVKGAIEFAYVDIAQMHAVIAAGFDMRYQAANLRVPTDFNTQWERDECDLNVGSHWKIDETKDCLVPLDQSNAEDWGVHPDTNAAQTVLSDYKMCPENKVSAIVPNSCFTVLHGANVPGCKHKFGLGKDCAGWVLEFAAGEARPKGKECEAGAEAIQKVDAAMANFRKALVDLSTSDR